MTDVIDPVELRAKMLAAMLAARTGDGQELLRSDMKWCAPAASAGILLDAALTAAEAADMVWVKRDVLDAHEKREKFMRGISPHVAAMMDEYDAPVAAILTGPEQERDAQ